MTERPICEVCGKEVLDEDMVDLWYERDCVCDDCWNEWKRQATLELLEWERGLL